MRVAEGRVATRQRVGRGVLRGRFVIDDDHGSGDGVDQCGRGVRAPRKPARACRRGGGGGCRIADGAADAGAARSGDGERDVGVAHALGHQLQGDVAAIVDGLDAADDACRAGHARNADPRGAARRIAHREPNASCGQLIVGVANHAGIGGVVGQRGGGRVTDHEGCGGCAGAAADAIDGPHAGGLALLQIR
ncbi:hypothetical protein SDC9_178054 [bioreactor metagenome]|uniref:Uncharacterized protein n=1 Tax=bioreactor metagenome TaxID=1076179 RepID=A0A645H425_9ZZZZ